MNRIKYAIPVLLVICTLLYSCGDGSEPEIIIENTSIVGEWTLTEQKIETGDSLLDNRLNWLFWADIDDYDIIRTTNESEPDLGWYQTNYYKKGSTEEIAARKKDGTFEIEEDSITISDPRLGRIKAAIEITTSKLTLRYKVSKTYIDALVSEIGGDPNLNPDDLEGIITTVEKR